MNAMRILACVIGASFVALGATRADDKSGDADALKADLRKLQGKWESTFKDKDGKVTLRKVKEIKDNTERVTWYEADGTVRMVNTVEFKLEMKEKDKVYNYSNGKIVEGPSKGGSFPSGSYSYTLEGDTWTEISTSGNKREWKRVKGSDKK